MKAKQNENYENEKLIDLIIKDFNRLEDIISKFYFWMQTLKMIPLSDWLVE